MERGAVGGGRYMRFFLIYADMGGPWEPLGHGRATLGPKAGLGPHLSPPCDSIAPLGPHGLMRNPARRPQSLAQQEPWRQQEPRGPDFEAAGPDLEAFFSVFSDFSDVLDLSDFTDFSDR